MLSVFRHCMFTPNGIKKFQAVSMLSLVSCTLPGENESRKKICSVCAVASILLVTFYHYIRIHLYHICIEDVVSVLVSTTTLQPLKNTIVGVQANSELYYNESKMHSLII